MTVQTTRADEIRTGFAHRHAADPVLAALIDANPEHDPDAWRDELPVVDLFGCLVFQTIGQQISMTAAQAVLHRLTALFLDGRRDEERLAGLPDDQVLAELTQVPGIGPWTVHGALLVSLRRADVVPTGDIVLRTAVRRYYRLDQLPTAPEFAAVAESWPPFGSLAVDLLFAAVELDTP